VSSVTFILKKFELQKTPTPHRHTGILFLIYLAGSISKSTSVSLPLQALLQTYDNTIQNKNPRHLSAQGFLVFQLLTSLYPNYRIYYTVSKLPARTSSALRETTSALRKTLSAFRKIFPSINYPFPSVLSVSSAFLFTSIAFSLPNV
jgi:hypothetical protein